MNLSVRLREAVELFGDDGTVGGAAHRALTLDSFAERLDAQPELLFHWRPGESGCGCMTVAA